MAQQKFQFKCYHADCQGEPATTVLLEVPEGPTSRERRRLPAYCVPRNHENMLTIPANWNRRSVVLGGDGLPRQRGAARVLRGEQPT